MSLPMPALATPARVPVRTLARAADLFRTAFVQAVEGIPISDLLDDWGDTLACAERVIDAWAAHLGISADDCPGGGAAEPLLPPAARAAPTPRQRRRPRGDNGHYGRRQAR
jgi:hypothetical protein